MLLGLYRYLIFFTDCVVGVTVFAIAIWAFENQKSGEMMFQSNCISEALFKYKAFWHVCFIVEFSVYKLQGNSGSSDLFKILNGQGLEYVLESKGLTLNQDRDDTSDCNRCEL